MALYKYVYYYYYYYYYYSVVYLVLMFLGSTIDGVLWWRMLSLHMFFQLTTDTELSEAMTADVWPVHPTAAVTMHMLPQVLGACKGFWTRRARMWLVAIVQLDVTTQVPDACKQYAADPTSELHHAVNVTHVIWLRVLHIGRFDCTRETCIIRKL